MSRTHPPKHQPLAPPRYLPLVAFNGRMEAIHRAYNRLVRHRGSRMRACTRWTRWSIAACQHVWKQTSRHGGHVREGTGKSRSRQVLEQLLLVFLRGLPPDAYMKFQLYDRARFRVAADYLHRYETKDCLFRLLNRRADKRVANDKQRFHDHCVAHGLATARVIASFPRASEAPLVLPPQDLMAKPRAGKGGRGVTRWVHVDGEYHDRARDVTHGPSALLAAMQRAATAGEPMLLQVAESNATEIEDLGRGVLTTARIMTCRRVDGVIEACCAVFRVPTKSASIDNFHAGGVAAAVDMRSGRLSAAITMHPRSPRYATVPGHEHLRIEGRVLPFFDEALALVTRAHATLDGFVVIGWDVGLTRNGPCLIEANSGPCVDTIQRPHGHPIGGTRLGELLLENLHAIPASEFKLKGRRRR